MLSSPKALVPAYTLLSFTATAFAGPIEPIFPAAAAANSHGWLGGPVGVTLDTRIVESGGAFGLHLVQPIFQGDPGVFLAEGYTYKGDAELGMAGAGLIFRRLLTPVSMLELNGFFDGLRDDDGFAYPQLGAGIAYSREWFTVRANGYVPLRDKEQRRSDTRRWTDANRRLGTRVEEIEWTQERFQEREAMRGFDAEVEFHLPQRKRMIDPRLAVGYYYREATDLPEIYSGVLVRGELRIGEHWLVDAEWRDDAGPIDQEWRVSLRYQRFFGGSKTAQYTESDAQLVTPARRSPWPSVAENRSWRGARKSGSREISDPAGAEISPGNCCDSGDAPLVFE